MPADKTYEVTAEKRLHQGFLNVDAISYRVTGPDGELGAPQTREVMERGDSAAILMLNTDQMEVVLVRQLRIAAREPLKPSSAWLLELPAGVINSKSLIDPSRRETAEECARREAEEETKYVVADLEPITTILPSPGGTSERIHIFFAKVRNSDKRGKRPPDPDEAVEVEQLALAKFLAMATSRDAVDAKLLVAAQWLKASRHVAASGDPLPPGERAWTWIGDLEIASRSKKLKPRVIGIQTGHLDDIEGIDIWINAENTDMHMARFFDRGISGRIRYLGAAKSKGGVVFTDTVADSLRSQLHGQVAVKPGSVVVSSPGDLRYSHGVKYIMHVACAQHSLFGSTSTDPAAIEGGFYQALVEADRMSRSMWRRAGILPQVTSMLTPLIGTGNAGLPADDIAQRMVKVAMKFFAKHGTSPFQKLFFLAFSAREEGAIRRALMNQSAHLIDYPAGNVRSKSKREVVSEKIRKKSGEPAGAT